MKAINLTEEKPNKSQLLSLNGKDGFSFRFLNKKRLNFLDNYEETIFKLKDERPNFFIALKTKNISPNFLEAFTQLANDPKKSFNRYYLKAKKRYFNSTFNLKLIHIIINYFSAEESNLRNADITNSKDLIKIVKTFLMNELEFSIFTLLINKYISNYFNKLEKDCIFYLGFYTKYISSLSYKDVFQEMLNTNLNLHIWYLQNKEFLENIDTSLLKINKGNKVFQSYNYNYGIIDFNSMTDDIFSPKKEQKKDDNNNELNSNIGKKVNLVIVYQEELSQDNTNYIDNSEASRDEKEDLHIEISV